MDLKTLVNKIPYHLTVAIKNVRLSPSMGYHSASFESLLELKRWLVVPSSDSPAAKAERKKLRRLVAEIRLALNLDTRGIDEN